MQVILFVIGFGIAWFMNVDTFTIVKKLSNDKDARSKMVQLASAYIENGKYEKAQLITLDTNALKVDTVAWKEYKALMSSYSERMDTLNAIRGELQEDLNSASTILGLGSTLPDTIKTDKKGRLILPDYIDTQVAKRVIHNFNAEESIGITRWQQFHYRLGLLGNHFLGYFVTALALSLGAPFWFDLLNKLMRLRGNMKETTPV